MYLAYRAAVFLCPLLTGPGVLRQGDLPVCVSPPACPRGQAHRQEVLQASPPEDLNPPRMRKRVEPKPPSRAKVYWSPKACPELAEGGTPVSPSKPPWAGMT